MSRLSAAIALFGVAAFSLVLALPFHSPPSLARSALIASAATLDMLDAREPAQPERYVPLDDHPDLGFIGTPRPTPRPTPAPVVAAAVQAPVAASGWLVVASWYGPGFYGNRTACGQVYTPEIVGVAHKTLPCGTLIQITFRDRTVVVPVIDRGPYIAGRELDLSNATRAQLACTDLCTVRMQIR